MTLALTIQEKIAQIRSRGLFPWKHVMGKDISEYSDAELHFLFEPWLYTYTEKKKFDFLHQFFLSRIPKDAQILDIGCGSGMMARSLAALGYRHVTAIDPDPDAIASGQLLAEIEQVTVNFRQAKFPDPDVTITHFDVVWMDSVLEHVQEYKDWLTILAKLISPGGYYFMIVPSIFGGFSLTNDMDWKHLHWKEQPYNHHPLRHCNHFWYRSLIREVEQAGFTHVATRKFQAYNAVAKLILKKMHLMPLYRFETRLDYSLAQCLPADMSTRVIIFRRRLE